MYSILIFVLNKIYHEYKKFNLIIYSFSFFAFTQTSESESKGEPHFKVFWNYNYDFSDDVTQTSAFELDRVYLGYKYKFNDNISAKITYDVGKNDAGSNYTAFVKIAQLDYKLSSKVKLSMGMIGGKQSVSYTHLTLPTIYSV